MIYEATPGQTVDRAAASAIEKNCDKFIHNERLYIVSIEWDKIGSVSRVLTVDD